MIAPRPTLPITVSIPALEHTRLMAALLKRYLYPDDTNSTGKRYASSKSAQVRPPTTIAFQGSPPVEKKTSLGQRLLSHTAGLLVIYTYALVILVNGGWRFGLGAEAKERRRKLVENRASLWSLDRDPYVGARHRFYTDADTGLRMHYVEAGDTSKGSELVILIHGFPDSYYSYRHQLTCKSLHRAHLIALDLPGFGGSDSLPHYNPTNVLNALSSFILAMKRRKSHSRCILVGHDWGAVVVCRLASECPRGMFSRAIVLSGLHPTLLASNTSHNLSSFSRTARSTIFVHHPLHILFSPSRVRKDLLRLSKSWSKNISPILRQARYSHYIFPMRLPWMFLARRLPLMADYWALRKLSKQAKCSDECSFLANSLGPGVEECETIGEEYGYGKTVRARKGWEMNEMVRYYRDGLAFYPWEDQYKPLALRELEEKVKAEFPGVIQERRRRRKEHRENGRQGVQGRRQTGNGHAEVDEHLLHQKPPTTTTISYPTYYSSSSTSPISSRVSSRHSTFQLAASNSNTQHSPTIPSPSDNTTSIENRFKCPVIVIFGSRDQFYEPDLVHHGWGKYFCYDATMGGSATIVLGKSGHWVHVGSRGREVVNGVLEWCVEEAMESGSDANRNYGGVKDDRERGRASRREMGGSGNEKDLGSSGDEAAEKIRELARLVKVWYQGEEAHVKCY